MTNKEFGITLAKMFADRVDSGGGHIGVDIFFELFVIDDSYWPSDKIQIYRDVQWYFTYSQAGEHGVPYALSVYDSGERERVSKMGSEYYCENIPKWINEGINALAYMKEW